MWRNGLPNPAAFGGLVYSRAADCLVAAMVTDGDDRTPFETLYARRSGERDYRRLAVNGSGLSLTDVVACRSTPHIVFNRWVRRASSPGAFDWDGVDALDLTTDAAEALLSRAALRALLGGGEGWISKIMSVTDDLGGLVASVASMPLEASSSRFSGSGHAVRYALCEVNLREPALLEITRLPNSFL